MLPERIHGEKLKHLTPRCDIHLGVFLIKKSKLLFEKLLTFILIIPYNLGQKEVKIIYI